jgi:hypothetical protein
MDTVALAYKALGLGKNPIVQSYYAPIYFEPRNNSCRKQTGLFNHTLNAFLLMAYV